MTRQLRRGQVIAFFKKQPPSLVGMEACVTAHHWAREICALGHTVNLIIPHGMSTGLVSLSGAAKDATGRVYPWQLNVRCP